MRKILALFVIFVLVFNTLGVNNLVFATFDISLTINSSTNPSLSFNPGGTFNTNFSTTNGIGEDIKETFVKIDFGNNSGFSYNGTNHKTTIGSTNMTSPVPSSAYNGTTGFSYEITNSTYPTITSGTSFGFKKLTNSFLGFSINSDISTYQNNISFWFEGKKVSNSSLVTGTSLTKVFYVNVRPHITDYYFKIIITK